MTGGAQGASCPGRRLPAGGADQQPAAHKKGAAVDEIKLKPPSSPPLELRARRRSNAHEHAQEQAHSPRWREAMVDSGMEMRQLGEQPLLGPYGTKNANKSVLRRRKAAWEKLVAKNLGVVLRFRQEKVEVRARCLHARLCASV